MRNTRLLKGLFLLVISLGVMFLQTNIVLAATNEDDLFSNTNFENASMIENDTDDNEAATIGNEIDNAEPNSSATNNTSNSTPTNNTAGNNSVGNNTSGNNTSGNNTARNNSSRNNTSTNRDVSNSNQLADTGIGQTGGIIAIIMVVGIISAIYSYKKVDDYKKL